MELFVSRRSVDAWVGVCVMAARLLLENYTGYWTGKYCYIRDINSIYPRGKRESSWDYVECFQIERKQMETDSMKTIGDT